MLFVKYQQFSFKCYLSVAARMCIFHINCYWHCLLQIIIAQAPVHSSGRSQVASYQLFAEHHLRCLLCWMWHCTAWHCHTVFFCWCSTELCQNKLNVMIIYCSFNKIWPLILCAHTVHDTATSRSCQRTSWIAWEQQCISVCSIPF